MFVGRGWGRADKKSPQNFQAGKDAQERKVAEAVQMPATQTAGAFVEQREAVRTLQNSKVCLRGTDAGNGWEQEQASLCARPNRPGSADYYYDY